MFGCYVAGDRNARPAEGKTGGIKTRANLLDRRPCRYVVQAFRPARDLQKFKPQNAQNTQKHSMFCAFREFCGLPLTPCRVETA
jgi:hypothetical protein